MMSWTNKHSISILSFVLFNPRCTTHTHMNTHANTSQSSCSQESLLIWSLSAGAGINKSKARNSRVLCSEPGASLSLSLSHPLSGCVCVCVSLRVCVSMHVNLKGHTDNVGLIWQSSGAVDQRQVWRMTLTVLDHSTSSTGSRKKKKKYFLLIYFFILFTEHHTLWLH